MDTCTTATEATKVCSECFRDLPAERFRKRRRDQTTRHSVCNDCFAAQARFFREARRQRDVLRYAQKVREANRDKKRLLSLTARICHRMGGVDKLAGEFSAALEGAKAAEKHYLVVRLLEATLDLVIVADELRPTEIRSMTDDELEQAYRREVADLIRCHPEIAIHAARQLGWSVTPNDTSAEAVSDRV